jgi:hypothetical protein
MLFYHVDTLFSLLACADVLTDLERMVSYETEELFGRKASDLFGASLTKARSPCSDRPHIFVREFEVLSRSAEHRAAENIPN